MLQQHLRRDKEAACLLAAVLVDGNSRYISYTSMQSIIAIRNDDRIIDVHLTTLVLLSSLVLKQQNRTSVTNLIIVADILQALCSLSPQQNCQLYSVI